jgi:hypothetical protein
VPSRLRLMLYLAQSCFILLLFLLQPFQPLWWLLFWPWLFVCFYQLLRQWQQQLPVLLFLSEKGELRWWQEQKPAGQLLANCLVSQWGIWLRWLDTEQKPQQLWLYRDNLSEADFRSLARVCQTVKWQQQTDSAARR